MSVPLSVSPPPNSSTGRYILLKLYNNIAGETIPREPVPRRNRLIRTDDVALMGLEEEFDEEDLAAFDEGESEEENVDVQAILFYGFTGRRRFPTLKTL
jgi:hypothetical protein